MTRMRHVSRIALILLFASVLFLPFQRASAQEAPPPAAGIDVVIVLDDSGSMATCWPWSGPPRAEDCPENQNPPSDPLNLRYSAARLLLQLAGDNDRLSVIRFNSLTQDLIGQLQPVGGTDARQGLVDALRPPTEYIEQGGYTRIDLGLNRALEILAGAEQGRPRYVILLTDGAPTQPGDVPRQNQAIQQTTAQLRDLGAEVFPVFLCNERAGCPDDTFIRETMGSVPERAGTADDLLQVFGALFARMKPDLNIVDYRNERNELQLSTRPAHGARQMVVVTKRDGLAALRRDGNAESVARSYQDDNILVNVVGADRLDSGTWTVETHGNHSFMVVQSETYAELTYPPPSVAGSPAAPRYVPAGKPVALIGRVVGPGSTEPLRLDDGTTLQRLAPGETPLWAVLPAAPGRLTLQAGDDAQPLQIRREFVIEARSDLPMALPVSPSPNEPCLPEAPCPLKVAFGPGPDVSEVQAVVYVTDESEGGNLVYSGALTCNGRECVDQAQDFVRQDGHTYTVRFFLQAHSNGVVFGDWVETPLVVEPAVYISGLPTPLNLRAQPAGGWPLTLTVGTTQDLGQLRATLDLTRTEDGSRVPEVEVDFSAAISGAGQQQGVLRVAVPPGLRPGNYEGHIGFTTEGAPAGGVRLPAPVPVTLRLAKPAASLLDPSLDFGTVLFETSPNFRISQTVPVRIRFSEEPFNITPAIQESTCPGLSVAAGAPQQDGDHYLVPVTLRSEGAVMPQTCSGSLTLSGPSEDYEIEPITPMAWRLLIPAVEWELLGVERGSGRSNDLVAGNMGRAGERGDATLLIRYTGKPPFAFNLLGLEGEAEGIQAQLGVEDVGLVTAEAAPDPDTPNVYRVPVQLVARKSMVHADSFAHWVSGTDYSGRLWLDIAGLPSRSPVELNFRFHNPGLYQRYIAPVYHWWWPGLITCPLSVLIPLVLFAFVWLRKKDADVERIIKRERAPQVPAELEPAGPPRPLAERRTATTPATAAAGAGGSGSGSRYRVPEKPSRKADGFPGLAAPTAGSAQQVRGPAATSSRPSRSLPVPPSRPTRGHRPRRTN